MSTLLEGIDWGGPNITADKHKIIYTLLFYKKEAWTAEEISAVTDIFNNCEIKYNEYGFDGKPNPKLDAAYFNMYARPIYIFKNMPYQAVEAYLHDFNNNKGYAGLITYCGEEWLEPYGKKATAFLAEKERKIKAGITRDQQAYINRQMLAFLKDLPARVLPVPTHRPIFENPYADDPTIVGWELRAGDYTRQIPW